MPYAVFQRIDIRQIPLGENQRKTTPTAVELAEKYHIYKRTPDNGACAHAYVGRR